MKAKQNDISLRDYFAAKAMQGTLSNYQWMKDLAQNDPDMPGCFVIAISAYEVADAMLKAKELSE